MEIGLHHNQKRYLYSELSTRHSFFIGVWYRLDGRLEADRLRAAIAGALARHESCRTAFRRTDDGSFAPELHPAPAFRFHEVAVADLAGSEVAQAAARFLDKPGDFADLETFHRFIVLSAGPDAHAVVFAQHHAVSDGRSLDLLVHEIGEIYSGRAAGLPRPGAFSGHPPEAVTGLERFWRDRFADLEETPRFHRTRRSTTTAPCQVGLDLGPEASADLDARAGEGTTAFSILAAAFAAQVFRQTGLPDVVFSIQSAGRHGFPQERVLGSFSNAVPVRVRVDPAEPFAELTRRLRAIVRDALRHEALGYQDILQVAATRPDFALNLYPDPEPVAFAGLAVGPRRFLPSESDYAVNLRWHRSAGGEMHLDLYFDANAVEPDRAGAFGRRAAAIAAAAVRAPHLPVGEILDAARLRPVPPPRRLEPPAPRRIWTLLRDAARVYPDRDAIRSDAGVLSYAELAAKVEARAGALHAAGIGTGAPVAFLARRDAEFPVTLLALSRLGAAFAAFDAEYPAARLAQQAESLGVREILAIGLDPSHLPDASVLHASGVALRRIAADEAGPPPPEPPAPEADAPAYFLFTSGTTGTPKRIGVDHAALPHFLAWQSRTFGITAEDRVSLLSGLGHDPVMRDVCLPLGVGAALTIPPAGAGRDPRALGDWLAAERPSVIHTTPAMGRLLSTETGAPHFPGARFVFWGGDMLPGDLARAAELANPGLTQVNFYGASETPQAVLCHVLPAAGIDPVCLTLPVGRPPDGIDARILGADGTACDVNEMGQVRILTPYSVTVAGVAVAGDRFCRQIYDTGDMGYLLPDGDIMLAGRRDDQVSIRGFRVEMGDVERQILALDDVAQACVLTDSAPDGQHVLVAHVVARPGVAADPVRLRRALAGRLPGYMVPTHVFQHDDLPLLPNGKRDRRALLDRQKALIAAAGTLPGTGPGAGPMTRSERVVADIFSGILGRPVANPSQSFVDLGADSLNSIQAMLKLERIVPDLPEHWQDQSISALAARVAPDVGPAGTSRVHRPFSLVQGELSVVFRALAIVAVVALHYKVFSVEGGTTAILFLLAGYSLVRFQLPKILNDGSVAPILDMVLRIGLLTIPVTLFLAVVDRLQGQDFQLADLLFYANFRDYVGPDAAPRESVWLWFIACYVQIMLLLALVLSFGNVRDRLRDDLGSVLIWGFVVTAILRFAVPAAVDPALISEGVPVLTKWNYLPTTHLPNVFLGGLVLLARRDASLRGIVLGLAVVYGLAVGLVFSHNRPEMLVAAVALLIWVGTVPLPRVLFVVFMAISQSSLYLYLLHGSILSGMKLLHIAPPPAIALVIAVIVSIGFGRVWERFLRAHDLQIVARTGRGPQPGDADDESAGA